MNPLDDIIDRHTFAGAEDLPKDEAGLPYVVEDDYKSASIFETGLTEEEIISESFPYDKFSRYEIKLLRMYTETQHGSQGINSYLRGAPPFDPKIPEIAATLQEMCYKARIPIKARVFRGVKNDGYFSDSDMAGQTITNYGFSSTSFDTTVPEQFATTTGPVGVGAVRDLKPTNAAPIIFDIQLPKHFPGLSVSALISDPAADAEHEFILPDGTKFYIVSDSQKNVAGIMMRWLMCAALVPTHTAKLPIQTDQLDSRYLASGSTMSTNAPEPGDAEQAKQVIQKQSWWNAEIIPF